jgi:hypothetical protein
MFDWGVPSIETTVRVGLLLIFLEVWWVHWTLRKILEQIRTTNRLLEQR